MNKFINIFGIETNNLKRIDVELVPYSINLIIGPSGSGKSSLAYETIAQIGQHEFMSMFADDISEPTYLVQGYRNMIAAVPLKQSNFNNNVRSTIGTYFGINRSVILIYSALLGLDRDLFVLNKEENLCEMCHGLGYITLLDVNKVVDYNIQLKKNPIRCWNRYKDFYSQILVLFCEDNSINPDKTFRQLTEDEKHLILYGESDKKYSVFYNKVGRRSSRTTKYYGIMSGKPMITNFEPSSKFYSTSICPICCGKKYAPTYEQYAINGVSIGSLMTMPFDQLQHFIADLIKIRFDDVGVSFAIKNIQSFISNAIKLNLGHLCLHRSIPSLSGGELQRLRMVQVLGTQLSDLLIVLDEPLAGLSGKEKLSVFDTIVDLSKKHTVVVVDHSDIFVDEAKNIIALGPGSGDKGGYVIDANEYLIKQKINSVISVSQARDVIHVELNSSIYSYSGVNIDIADNCLNLITGSSGVGKSTLLREYFPQYFDKYLYINQKPLLGNKNSSVATVLAIATKIASIFADKYKKDRRFFSNQPGCDGMCPTCLGAGYIEYGNGYGPNIQLVCKNCDGTGFNKQLSKYQIQGKNIFDVWNMTIDEAIEFFAEFDKKITQPLKEASSLLLGHLKIGQRTSTLSGGENVRVKLLSIVNSKYKVLGIDEPFRGLSPCEIYVLIQFLDRVREQGRTIVVIDHSDGIEQYFAKHISLICEQGVLQDCMDCQA